MAEDTPIGQVRTRLTISLPPSGRQRLDDVQRRSESASMGAAVGRALAVYELILDLRERGCVIESVSPDGERSQIVVVP